MVLHNQASKHRWTFYHLFLEFQQWLDIFKLVRWQVPSGIFLAYHKLFEAIDRVIEQPYTVIGDTSNAFVEVPYQVSDCLHKMGLANFVALLTLGFDAYLQ